MSSRRSVPLALLAVLALLTLGFAVLALVTAPKSADLAVHNGTAETLSARQFSLNLFSASRTGQNAAQTETRVIDYSAPDRMVVYRATPALHLLGSLHPDAIEMAIAQYTAVTAGSTHWARNGSHFDRTESLSAYEARQGGKDAPPGTVTEQAVVRGGYLVAVILNLKVESITDANGQKTVGGTVKEILHFLRINGAKAPDPGPLAG
jgi:hypothetical protein